MKHLSHNEESLMTGAKFVVKCEDMKCGKWLETVKDLMTTDAMLSEKTIEEILTKHRHVVMKIAYNDDTEEFVKDWEAFQMLKTSDIPNTIEHLCMFKCNDDIKTYIPERMPVCRVKGEMMQVLVMQHVPNGSFATFNWSTVPIEAFRSCIKQTILVALNAFVRCGFVHGDLHLDNVLVQSTNTTRISYDVGGTVDLHGLEIKWMDFEASSWTKDLSSFFRNIHNFINHLCSLLVFIEIDKVVVMDRLTRWWCEDLQTDPLIVLTLLPLCEGIKSSGLVSKTGNGEFRPQRRICFGRK
jgi:hypothetical protein